jgi:hypothetical protein
VRDALAQCDTVAAAREYHAAGATLNQLGLFADAQSECQETAFQPLATINPDQAQTLPYSQIDKWNCLRHRGHLLMIMILNKTYRTTT